MRKVVMINRISIDGYFATNNEKTAGMDWFIQDPNVDAATHKPVHSDTLLLGTKTFDLFEHVWVPALNDPNTPPPMKAVAQELTNMHKIAFTDSAKESDWANTSFHSENLVDFVEDLKKQDGTDILILGSGSIVEQLAAKGLIDEYQFVVSPVIAGDGKPLFGAMAQQNLELVSAQAFDSGNVVLHYKKRSA